MARLGSINSGTDLSTVGGGGGGVALPPYATTNVTIDRILNADAASLDEVADVLGTLIIDIQAGGGGSTQALAETRAAAISSTIGVAVKSLRTAGYAAVGDGGHGLYKRRATAPTLTNPGYFRSVDSFKADGITDSTNGGWWELVPEAGRVTIEQFGGKADSNGLGSGTDNVPALYDALAFSPWSASGNPFTYIIQFGAGRYRFSKTIYYYVYAAIQGVNMSWTLHSEARTMLDFPNNASGFVFHGLNTGPNGSLPGGGGESALGVPSPGHGSSMGSTVENIGFSFAAGGWIIDRTKSAIFSRTTIHLKNIYISSAPGNGVFIRAYAGYGGDIEGNANQWSCHGLYVHTCGGDAWMVEGGDTNGGHMLGLATHGSVVGCGIRNLSWLPNAYHGMQITGYGNNGVHYAGKLYTLIGGPASTTPGTNNDVWYLMYGSGGPSAGFPEWNASDPEQAVLKLPIFDSGGGSHYYDPYVEIGGAAIGLCPAPSRVFGGTLGFTLNSNMDGASRDGWTNYHAYPVGSVQYANNGPSTAVTFGGSNDLGPDGSIQFIKHNRGTEGVAYQFGYQGAGGRNNVTYCGTTGQAPIFELTMPTTTVTAGKGSPAKNLMLLWDFLLQDPSDSNVIRQFGIRYPGSINRTGAYALGERYFNAGSGYWVCTTAGAISPSIWSLGVLTDGNTLLKTTAGRFYTRPAGASNSTDEPVHTSGTVTGADGIAWTYVTDTTAVLTFFSDIQKQAAPYTTSNVATDRAFDANATTVEELADIVGTLIADLKAAGVIS